MLLNEISAKAERVKKHLFDSASNIEVIESKNRDQHNSMLWYNVRKPRITASQGKRFSKVQKDIKMGIPSLGDILFFFM